MITPYRYWSLLALLACLLAPGVQAAERQWYGYGPLSPYGYPYGYPRPARKAQPAPPKPVRQNTPIKLEGLDPVRDRATIVAKAAWRVADEISVEMTEYAFTPAELRFTAGKAYRLVIRNVGKENHYFTAPDFFRAVAARKVLAKGLGEIKAPHFLALEVFPGKGELELSFVPVTKGEYELVCTIPGHKDHGMHGKIIIE